LGEWGLGVRDLGFGIQESGFGENAEKTRTSSCPGHPAGGDRTGGQNPVSANDGGGITHDWSCVVTILAQKFSRRTVGDAFKPEGFARVRGAVWYKHQYNPKTE